MYRISLICLIVVIAANVNLFAQKGKKTTEKDLSSVVLANVGNEKITYAELEKAYQKNLSRKNLKLNSLPKDSLLDFLNLYIKFRLKVNDAISRGLDKDSSVYHDLEQNRKLLAESFYFDKMLTEPNVNEMLERRKKEMKFGVIMTSFNQATMDTAAAYKKIQEAQQELKNGAAFDSIARKYSMDRSTAETGGIIAAYITSGRMHKVIEDAIYNTKLGEVNPNIIQTRFGFFLIKLVDVVDRVKIKASHILITPNENRDSVASYKLADSIYQAIKNGADFSKMAERFSEDQTSASHGGSLMAYYSRSTGLDGSGSNNNLLPEFESALYKLKDGEISNVVRTDYGYHIIRRDSTKAIDLNSEKQDLKNYYKKNLYTDEKRAYLDNIRKKYDYKINEDNLKEVLSYLDTNVTNLTSNWTDKIPAETRKKELFTIKNHTTTMDDYIKQFNTKTEMRGIGINKEGILKGIDLLVEPIILAEETKNLETQYPDFAAQMKEFRDGILLFKLETQEVWDKLKIDSINARKFYDSTASNYKTDYQYDITEIFSLSDSSAKIKLNKIKQGADFVALAENETERTGFREKKGQWGLVELKDNKLAKYAAEKNAKPGDVLGIFAVDNGYSIIKVNDVKAPRTKTFEEALKELSPKWQDLTQKTLTFNWLESAKKKFPVKIDTKAINEICK